MALRPGISTFEDAQALRGRYQDYVRSESNCQPELCSFWIVLPNAAYREWLDREWLRSIGFRPARATTRVAVEQGNVSRVSFAISYRTAEGYWFAAETKAVNSFTLEEQCLNRSFKRHPNYEVTSGNITTVGGGRFMRASNTSAASRVESDHARKINLRCIVRVPDCTFGELMPFAHRDLEEDGLWRSENWKLINDHVEKCRMKPAH